MCRCDATYWGTSHNSSVQDALWLGSSSSRVYVALAGLSTAAAIPAGRRKRAQGCAGGGVSQRGRHLSTSFEEASYRSGQPPRSTCHSNTCAFTVLVVSSLWCQTLQMHLLMLLLLLQAQLLLVTSTPGVADTVQAATPQRLLQPAMQASEVQCGCR